ncbi:MAG: ribosomal L7Ae/L30e/S12e/Gadd45 family protein [Syntrophaceticus sp.]|nr:ribosomal L7Ae/L30e/S12e/Gadd45 family protein [Syntrophaceticus sp.]MDD4782210.1 ribosomal L7Ae/L30e/S12e/Gadd45 family protein [Syntrophaceticus sp.]
MTFLTLMGFAKKANKIVYGMSNCQNAVRKDKAKLVIITADAGKNRKKIIRECQSLNIPFLEYGNKDLFLRSIGNPACYWAVLSQGIAVELMREFEKEKVRDKPKWGD